MSYSNGRLPTDSEGQTPLRGLPGVGFSLTEEGDFDIKGKKLTNVKEGTDKTDAVIRSDISALIDAESGKDGVIQDKVCIYDGNGNIYADNLVLKSDAYLLTLRCRNIAGDRNLYVPSLTKTDYILTIETDQTINGIKTFTKPIIQTREGTDVNHLVTKNYIDTELGLKIDKTEDSIVGSPQGGKLTRYLSDKGLITPKMYIEDQFGDSIIIKSEDQDYDDVNLHIPNLQNYDGISGRRKSSFVINSIDNNMTGKIILPSGNLVIKDGNNQTVLNRADIEKLYGSSGGNNGINNNKCVLYSSDGSVYANNYAIKKGSNIVFLRCRDQSGWRSLFIPSLSSDATIIIDQTNQTIDGNKTFSKAITMSQEGSANNHLVTKGYVDDEIAKIPSGSGSGNVNTSNFLKKDGSVAMTGDLNMNEQRVKNTLDPTDEQDTVNKRYLESQLTDYLKRNGQSPMTFDLNMNRYKIVNLKDINNFSIDSEAVNKKYVDAEIAKIPSIDTSNFLKLDGSVAMSGNLNMATNKIKNLGTPTTNENDAAINVEFFKSELNTSNQNLSTQITTAYKKYIDEYYVTPSEHLRKTLSAT